MEFKVEVILTYFEKFGQEIKELKLPSERFETERKLKNSIIADLPKAKKDLLVKASCCIIADMPDNKIPSWYEGWYKEANGKLWFNDDKRTKYGLN